MMNFQNNQYGNVSQRTEAVSVSNTFVSGVFMWMFVALSITALTAWWFATTPALLQLLINPTGGMTLTGWVVMLAPLALVLIMSGGARRMSAATMLLLFILFSILMGASLSFIFLAYTGASIAKTFFITSGMFGVMAVVGYTTKTDLTKFGSILFMGLIGIIIASVVNMFMHSGSMDYIISFLGVLIFTGLTAYDVQKIKRIGAQVDGYSADDSVRKMMLFGALSLYLDFINLFLFLLRFFGNRK
ncbi:MAG: BAX inhibitor (BI)-1/YccA family protein [Bacteroidetes bacterium]|nr:MAG: BAX inhibitor (BI)-1/YccA family protein [Bacteroidota bacterium]